MHALSAPVPPGWVRAGEIDGIPLWRWRGEAFYAATGDMDQLLFIGAFLDRFDRMSREEFHACVAARTTDKSVEDERHYGVLNGS